MKSTRFLSPRLSCAFSLSVSLASHVEICSFPAVPNRKKGLRIAVISKPMIGNSTRCKTAKRAPFGETGCGLRGEWLHEGGRENRPTFGRVRSQAVTTAVKRAFMRQFGWYRRNLTSCPLEFGTRGFTFIRKSLKVQNQMNHIER